MIVDFAMAVVSFSALLVSFRVLKGPSWGDRIMAFDFLSMNLVVLFALGSIQTGFAYMLDATIVLSLLGFLSTLALTRYLLLGRVIRLPPSSEQHNKEEKRP